MRPFCVTFKYSKKGNRKLCGSRSWQFKRLSLAKIQHHGRLKQLQWDLMYQKAHYLFPVVPGPKAPSPGGDLQALQLRSAWRLPCRRCHPAPCARETSLAPHRIPRVSVAALASAQSVVATVSAVALGSWVSEDCDFCHAPSHRAPLRRPSKKDPGPAGGGGGWEDQSSKSLPELRALRTGS